MSTGLKTLISISTVVLLVLIVAYHMLEIQVQTTTGHRSISEHILKSGHHRCRKCFPFWERGDAFRKFLSEVQFSTVLRSIKTPNISENILNMEKF